ncbi:hypothetical protein JOD57_003869 [Geodermatophilus bullaregiensis]|uniref:histone-like nucleoid-structuring protein Lsr2 n=1 Tax=Geodermatophilus bullaregiensis TaxID=1564160 RepID=UPI0027DAF27E|nr:Lsr2 family protein [Geodermatophilus bullaregiensis]MBM7808032.1 hypothetical protein [Geodermatophilus bullaregiensis]
MKFGISGPEYEIDLRDNNAAEFRNALSKYVSAARKVGSTSKGRVAVRHTTTDSIDPAAVRAWAKGQRIDVSPRGRIKTDVVERFRAKYHAGFAGPDSKTPRAPNLQEHRGEAVSEGRLAT